MHEALINNEKTGEVIFQNKNRQECLVFIKNNINAFYDFQNSLDNDKLDLQIKNYLNKINVKLQALDTMIKNQQHKYILHSHNHFNETLGHLLGSTGGLILRTLRGKEKFVPYCVERLEEFNNYFASCLENEEYLQSELATKDGILEH